MRRKPWLLAALMVSLCPGVVSARTSLSRVVPQILADQNPRPGRDIQRAGPVAPAAPGRALAIQPFVLRSVVIDGSSLPPGELAAAWRPFVGRLLDANSLARVTDALEAVYARADIAMYAVTAETQDVTNGVLGIRMVEGSVERAEITASAGDRNRALVQRYVDKIVAERPLRRSTLQRYVSAIRDIPGLESQVNLETGDTDGGLRMRLALRPHPVQLGLAINNQGVAYLGRTQVQADLYLNSVLRQGDQTRLTVAAPWETRLLQSYSVEQVEPIGANGLVATLSANYLRTRPKDTDLLGHATTVGAQLSYPLLRSYDQSLVVSVGVDGVNNRNAFLGFTFADDRTRALRAAVAYDRQAGRLLLVARGALSLGIDGLGARATERGSGNLDFRKFNGKVGASFGLGGRGTLRLNAAGQWASGHLPATEQFALGGAAFGRGYAASVIAGDYGIAGSAELAFRPARMPALLGGSESFAFIDGGSVGFKTRSGWAPDHATLASAGFGVRAKVADRAIVQLEAAKPIDNQLPFPGRRGWRGLVTIRALF